ncbi:MAG: DNA (cytosine-5)-methyltransferase 1 [Crocinitomicaceae bacterium]|jgi:DNA (cytosine-5)-methyltransferase 1
MIDFILDKDFIKGQNRTNEIVRDLTRILELEDHPIERFESIPWTPSENEEHLKTEIGQQAVNAYGTIYSSESLINHHLIKKFLPSKEDSPTEKPLFADFFSGAGGLGLGLEQAGFKSSFVSDHNKSALQTYYLNRDLPLENYHLGDMKGIVENLDDYAILKDTFLIAGGPPCQGFSMANRQPLLNDPRNELYKDFLQVLEETTPPFFILENVRGMAKKREEIEADMKRMLGGKYKYCFLSLNAKNYDIPQNRERLFIIGNRIGVNPEEIANSIKSQGLGTKYSLKHALMGLPEIEAGTEFNQTLLENDRIGYKINKVNIPQTEYSNYINDSRTQEYVFNHKSRYNNDNDIEIFRRLPQGANSLHESIQDIMKYKSRNDIFKDKYYRLKPDSISKAITSHMKFDCHMYIHPSQARGLSPREAARIQTFPDDYIFMGRPNEWYQQIGNAVPVKLAKVLGNEIMKYWK